MIKKSKTKCSQHSRHSSACHSRPKTSGPRPKTLLTEHRHWKFREGYKQMVWKWGCMMWTWVTTKDSARNPGPQNPMCVIKRMIFYTITKSRPSAQPASTPVKKWASGDSPGRKLYQRGTPVIFSASPVIFKLRQKYSLCCTLEKNGWSRWKFLEIHPRWNFSSPLGHLVGMY